MYVRLRNSVSPARIRRSLVLLLGLGLIASPSTTAAAQARASVDGLWGAQSATPSETCTSSARLGELGVQFTPTRDGFVQALGFYRTPRNTGSRVGRLYEGGGQKLADVTYASKGASGWQYATLQRPISVKKGGVYVVSYDTSTGCYARTAGLLASPRTAPSATVPADGTVARSGGRVFYGSGGATYWADVVFSGSPAISTPSPSVPSQPTPTTPGQNTTGQPSTTVPGSRSKYSWPFSSKSIWNMPLGSSAQYVPLGMTPPTVGYATDEVYLPFSTSAPLRPVVDRAYWWPWVSGLTVSGARTGVDVRLPDGWLLPPPAAGEYPNRASAALQADGLAREFQYAVRPMASSAVSMSGGLRAAYDLTGDGLTGPNGMGAHGGSGMSAIGGTVRSGELTSREPIRHALAVTMNMRKWGTAQGGKVNNGYRWPAIAADSGYSQTAHASGYGTLSSSGKDGVGMGSLLALPPAVDLSALKLETSQGAKLAWTYQNYGAYVVDDSVDPGNYDVHRLNVEEAVLSEYPAVNTGFTTNTPFGRDMNKIFTRLAVVDNNGPASVGGGGVPRQPLAPGFRD